jgi:hypothetical protein
MSTGTRSKTTKYDDIKDAPVASPKPSSSSRLDFEGATSVSGRTPIPGELGYCPLLSSMDQPAIRSFLVGFNKYRDSGGKKSIKVFMSSAILKYVCAFGVEPSSTPENTTTASIIAYLKAESSLGLDDCAVFKCALKENVKLDRNIVCGKMQCMNLFILLQTQMEEFGISSTTIESSDTIVFSEDQQIEFLLSLFPPELKEVINDRLSCSNISCRTNIRHFHHSIMPVCKSYNWKQYFSRRPKKTV